MALGTFIGRARRDPRVEAFYLSSYIDYAPSAFKSSSDQCPAWGSCLRGRARGVAAAANAGTQLAFWARARRLIAGDKERPTSWRERGPRLWDLSPEHALSNVRNHHSRRPRGSRVSIFGDPGVGRRKTRRRQRGVRASWPGIEVAARELVTARRQAPPGSRVREGLVVVRGRRRR